MEMKINRIRYKERSIDGELFINGFKICDTAEATVHHLPAGEYEVKLYKCQKAGRQLPRILIGKRASCTSCCKMEAQRSKLRGKVYDRLMELQAGDPSAVVPLQEHELICNMMQQVLDIPVTHCPQIRPGNGVFGTPDGGILVGRYLAPGILTNSLLTFSSLIKRLRKAADRGNKLSLTIIG